MFILITRYENNYFVLYCLIKISILCNHLGVHLGEVSHVTHVSSASVCDDVPLTARSSCACVGCVQMSVRPPYAGHPARAAPCLHRDHVVQVRISHAWVIWTLKQYDRVAVCVCVCVCVWVCGCVCACVLVFVAVVADGGADAAAAAGIGIII